MLAFFRVKLDGADIIAAYNGGVGPPVIGKGNNIRRIFGGGILGVGKIGEIAGVNVAQQRVVSYRLNLIPAHVGYG